MLEREGPIVAAALVVAAVLLVLPDDDRDAIAEPPPPAATAFLEAYERSRSVEVVVVSEFTRTFPDGDTLVYEQRIVQRPPDDRLVIGAGTASGRIGGRVVRCNDEGSGPTCVEGAEAPPYADEVAGEVIALAEMVDPDRPVYEVTLGGAGCFDLRLAVQLLTPPYGVASTFCFDPDTGVLVDLVVERPEVVDRTVAVEVRTEVTDADLRAGDLGEPLVTG